MGPTILKPGPQRGRPPRVPANARMAREYYTQAEIDADPELKKFVAYHEGKDKRPARRNTHTSKAKGSKKS